MADEGDMNATYMATWVPEIWSSLANLSYHTVVVLPPLMDRRWEPELGVGRGDLVNIPAFTQKGRDFVNKRSTFGTGDTLTFNYVTEAKIQLQANQMGIYAFRMPVEMSVQRLAQYEKLLTDAAGPSLAEQVDYELASGATYGLHALTIDIGSDNVDVTDDLIIEAETNLNAVNAPLEDRFFVFSTGTFGSLRAIEKFANMLYKSAAGNLPQNVGQGYVGDIYSLHCYMSNNLATVTNGKQNYIFHRYAVAYAEQVSVKVEKGLNIADGLFNEYAAYNVYGSLMVKPTWGYGVQAK